MTGYLDKLTPNERRLVVLVGVVVFAMLNVWFVGPRFGDLGRARARLYRAQDTLKRYQLAASKLPEFERRVRELEKDNPGTARDDQSIELLRAVQSTAGRCGVGIMNVGKLTTKTNDFFIEQSIGITVQAREEQLVNFLYELGASESIIRVRALSLRPDPSRMQLGGNVTLAASYQRKPLQKQAGAAPVAARTGTLPPPKQEQVPKPATPTSRRP
ncbi:MAG: hypothetical protein NZ739_03365 [Verrucomicrobiae bacterium]|nr:hypothetical protein [Verrucomicrobiae bacterium]MDW7979963.1 hypothetical protein [Verrucomicrobiales bacterium]